MKPLIALLLFACVSSHAAFVTINATFTNRSLISSNFVIDGVTVRYTNAPLNNSTWIVTNAAAQNATNLMRFLGANYPKYYSRLTTATNVAISGNDLQFSFPGNSEAHFAFTTTSSLTVTQGWFVTLPWVNQTETNRTNTASELIAGLGNFSTNAFPMSAAGLSNHVNRTNAQIVSHKYIHLSILSNSFVVDSVFSGGAFSNRIVNAGTITGGIYTNATLTNSAFWSGTLAGTILNAGTIAGGAYTNGTHTNSVWGSGSIMGRITSTAIITGGGMSNTVADGLTATNLSSPGTGLGSEKLGSLAIASGVNSVAFGNSAVASGTQSTALGMQSQATAEGAAALGSLAIASSYYAVALGSGEASAWGATAVGAGSVAAHSNSVAIGVFSTTTTTNQIRLGTATEHVSIPGDLRDVLTTNELRRGTNVLNGDQSVTRYDISTLANGNNIAVVFGTNYNIRASGTVTGVATLCGIVGGRDGLKYEVRNALGYNLVLTENTVDPTPANRFDFTDNADVTVIDGGKVYIKYNSSSSRWEVENLYPSVASLTNLALMTGSLVTNTAPFSGNLTNPIVSGMFWTNATGGRVLLAINALLTASVVSGAPSLCITNISSGQTFNLTNSLALSVVSAVPVSFLVGPNEYIVVTNKSDGSASASVAASFARVQ